MITKKNNRTNNQGSLMLLEEVKGYKNTSTNVKL